LRACSEQGGAGSTTRRDGKTSYDKRRATPAAEECPGGKDRHDRADGEPDLAGPSAHPSLHDSYDQEQVKRESERELERLPQTLAARYWWRYYFTDGSASMLGGQ